MTTSNTSRSGSRGKLALLAGAGLALLTLPSCIFPHGRFGPRFCGPRFAPAVDVVVPGPRLRVRSRGRYAARPVRRGWRRGR